MRETGKMTTSEAGRRGGLKVRDAYGVEFYEEIGHKGGKMSSGGKCCAQYLAKGKILLDPGCTRSEYIAAGKAAIKGPRPGQKTGMTVRQAGRKGGETTSERYGKEFYEEIGRKGGEKILEEYGVPFFEEIGAKGRRKTKSIMNAGRSVLGLPQK